jgi:hypothetical protein
VVDERHIDLDDLGPQVAVHGEGLLERRGDGWVIRRAACLAGHSEAEAIDRRLRQRSPCRHGLIGTGGVELIVAADDFQHGRGIGDGGGEGTDLVETAGEGDEAVAAHTAVRRLHPNHATEPRRLTDRAAGV